MPTHSGLSDDEFVEQTHILTQSIMNVMMLEMAGKPSSAGVFGCALSQVLAIVAASVIESSGTDSTAWLDSVRNAAKDAMDHPEVMDVYLQEAFAVTKHYRQRVAQQHEINRNLN